MSATLRPSLRTALRQAGPRTESRTPPRQCSFASSLPPSSVDYSWLAPEILTSVDLLQLVASGIVHLPGDLQATLFLELDDGLRCRFVHLPAYRAFEPKV